MGSRVIIKYYQGKPFFIIKGYAGLRKILTGARYGIQNPKIVSLGIGKFGALNAIKSSGILSIVLITTYRVFDYFMTDEQTLSDLIGHLATDIIKIGMVAIISIGAVLFASALAVYWGALIAVAPLIFVLGVSSVATYYLDLYDGVYGITDKVVEQLEKFNSKAEAYFKSIGQDMANATDETLNAISGNTLKMIPEWK